MEEKEKLGQEPAFPVVEPNSNMAAWVAGIDPTGMSKRFYAACAAMQGIVSMHKNTGDIDNGWICKAAFNMADELLKQENI